MVHPVPFREGREKCTTGVAQEQQRTRNRAEKRPLFGKRTVIMPGGAARGRRRISQWTTPSTTWANSPLPTPGRVDSINARISSGGCGPSRESKVGEQEPIHPALRNASCDCGPACARPQSHRSRKDSVNQECGWTKLEARTGTSSHEGTGLATHQDVKNMRGWLG